MIFFGQVALRVNGINEAIARYKSMGHLEWIQDTVDAVHIYKSPELCAQPDFGDTFQVRLAFNYTVIPGTEFELIQLLAGNTIQLQHDQQLLSHFGYHTAMDQAESTKDSLLEELLQLQDKGFSVRQVSQTVNHTGTRRRYRYAYVNSVLGAPVKIIQRLLPIKRTDLDASLAQGRELFACLE